MTMIALAREPVKTGRAPAVIATLLLLVAAAPLLVRAFELDRGSFLLSGLVGVRPIAILPALMAVTFASAARKQFLMFLSLVAFCAHLFWSMPALARPGPVPHAPGTDVSVMSINLLYSTTDLDSLAAELDAAPPDVLVLVELTHTHMDELQEVLERRYRYSHAAPADGVAGIGIWSVHPVNHSSIEPLTGSSWPAVRAFLDVEGDTVQVLGVHPPPPTTPAYSFTQERELGVIERISREIPTVIVGDFNASIEHAVFRDFLTETGMRDVHAEAGGLINGSWPTHLPAPPVLHIDHILISEHFAIEAAFMPDVEWGGDHRPVAAHLVLTPDG